MRSAIVLGGHCVFLASILVSRVEELLHHLWWHPCHLLEEIRVLDPFSESHHDDCITNARDGVLLHEPSDEFPEGLTLLLMDLIQIPIDSSLLISTLKIINKPGTEISPGINRILWKSRELVLYQRG